MDKNIILCGFMSCGKTTVGKKLAKFLGYKFVDTDHMIEEYAKKSIKEIFNEGGEELFRDIEHIISKQLNQLSSCVISTGGGLMTYDRNVDVIEDAFVVYIDTDFETCYSRLQNTGRPIVSSKTKQEMEAMYDDRIKKYKNASSFTVSGGNVPSVTVGAIADIIKNNQ